MFITLQNGAMLNLFWLQDCFQGKHDTNIVIFYLINGTKIKEVYATAQEALDRVNAVHTAMSTASFGVKLKKVNELPEVGEQGIIYLVPKDTTLTDNIYDEYVWTMDSTWEKIGDTKIDLFEYISVNPQVFSDAQKLQARTNIGIRTPEIIVNTVQDLPTTNLDDGYIAYVKTDSTVEGTIYRKGYYTYNLLATTWDFAPFNNIIIGDNADKFLNESGNYQYIRNAIPFPDTFVTNYTTEALCLSVSTYTGTIAGMSFSGGVALTDMPFAGNAECMINVIANIGGDLILELILTSTNISPYKWIGFYNREFYGWKPCGLQDYSKIYSASYELRSGEDIYNIVMEKTTVLEDGLTFLIRFPIANTSTNVNLKINNLITKKIKILRSNPEIGDIALNSVWLVSYDYYDNSFDITNFNKVDLSSYVQTSAVPDLVRSVRPEVRTILNNSAQINTIYNLGEQTELTINLPQGQYGDFIQVDFKSGEPYTNLIINSPYGMSSMGLIPESGVIYSLYFNWGLQSDGISLGWRCDYSQYDQWIL